MYIDRHREGVFDKNSEQRPHYYGNFPLPYLESKCLMIHYLLFIDCFSVVFLPLASVPVTTMAPRKGEYLNNQCFAN